VITIFVFPEEINCKNQRGALGHKNGPPDAVQFQSQRQHKHRAHLEQKRPQKGDQSGDKAVVQGGEEG
jgi:hypothetical protein